MTARQIELVRASWDQVSALDATVVGELFYTRLLGTHPELQQMFKSPLPEQSRKLIAMLGFIISRLNRLEEITEHIQKLATRHAGYGVQPAHYEMVGAALLWTLQRGLPDDWNPELEVAWAECYALLSSAMINASREVTPA
jgi:hemoglobin-like flavoprotein